MLELLHKLPYNAGHDPQWREKEPGLREVIRKYPDIPPLVILKTDLQRRGVKMTKRASAAVDTKKVAVNVRANNFENLMGGPTPVGVLLRDGSSVITYVAGAAEEPFARIRDPYYIDLSTDGKPVIVDDGEVIDEAIYWPRPDYYDKVTRKGTPMWQVLGARPQRLEINGYQNCDFWKKGQPCRYCYLGFLCKMLRGKKNEFIDLEDAAEAVGEALKQPGRYRSIQLCNGTMLGGAELLDDEVDYYIDILHRIERYLPGHDAMVQMVATAFNERQLRRLKDETILTGYTSDIEVLDAEVFQHLCPGKANAIGYAEWKNRLFRAVDIFGAGRVTTGIVSGAEFAQPGGFTTEEEALERCLAEAEDFAKHGVGICQTVYNNTAPGCALYKQRSQTLEYNIAFLKGLDAISRRWGVGFEFDDYRTCGNHPNTDLARI
ncbi:MAG: radical SAM protein [Oscillospiraceae bacterium]|jgi:hypothetical protein|nr:radical SAM protein [Oscillospiraceae bacterium]